MSTVLLFLDPQRLNPPVFATGVVVSDAFLHMFRIPSGLAFEAQALLLSRRPDLAILIDPELVRS